MRDKSGALGVLGLIGIVILYFVLRRFFPSLSTLLLVIGGVILLVIVLIVAVVIYFAFRKPKGKDGAPGAADLSAVLSKGRSNLMELRRMGMRVKNQQIRKLNEEICGTADKILRTLKEQPEDIPRVRQFFNYYLPTLGNILLKYVRLEESGVPAANMTESTISCLGDIKTAMGKQYTNLFDNDMLDLSVEMEALTLACKRDGLLEDENFQLQDGDRNITLTL